MRKKIKIKNMNKIFNVAQVRNLLNQLNNEEITFSRFVEILNEAQKEAYNQAKREMFLNMQYYMEYCLSNKYVTPQEWIEKHKHF